MEYLETFMKSLESDKCPDSLSRHLQALWHDAQGNWDKAHTIIQVLDDKPAAQIHAYLHRKEGDDTNARYWHRRAGTTFPADLTLEAEWQLLVTHLTED